MYPPSLFMCSLPKIALRPVSRPRWKQMITKFKAGERFDTTTDFISIMAPKTRATSLSGDVTDRANQPDFASPINSRSLRNQLKIAIIAMVAKQIKILRKQIPEKRTIVLNCIIAFPNWSKEQVVSADNVAHMCGDIRNFHDNHINLSRKVDVNFNLLSERVRRLEK